MEYRGFSADSMDKHDRARGITRVIELGRLGPDARDREHERYFARVEEHGC